jgi:hypothetical protein
MKALPRIAIIIADLSGFFMVDTHTVERTGSALLPEIKN